MFTDQARPALGRCALLIALLVVAGTLSVAPNDASAVDPLPPSPGVSGARFEGLNTDDNPALGETKQDPPDLQIAVGPDHIVQMVNSVGRIYDRNLVAVQSFRLENFFSGTIGEWPFDGRVVYDDLSDRWFAVAISRLGGPFSEPCPVSDFMRQS